MRGRVLLIGLLALLALGLYGCDAGQGSGGVLGVPKVSQGWARYGGDEDGFTLDAPSSWAKLDFSGADLDSAIQLMSASNEALGTFLNNPTFKSQLNALTSSGVKLMLYDTLQDVSLTGFATNINVVSVDVPDSLDLTQVMDSDIKQIESALGSGLLTPVSKENVTLNGVPALKLNYSYRINLPTGDFIDASLLQYGMVAAGKEYILTFTTTPEEQKLRSITFDAIARKWRVFDR